MSTQRAALSRPAWREIESAPGAPLHPVEVGQQLNAYLAGAENSVFVCDGGEFGQWMQALVTAPNRLINGKSGSIGSIVPMALAARLAFPDSRLVACSGDGAFGFQPFEFETAIRHHIPTTVLIGNDSCWNAEYQSSTTKIRPGADQRRPA